MTLDKLRLLVAAGLLGVSTFPVVLLAALAIQSFPDLFGVGFLLWVTSNSDGLAQTLRWFSYAASILATFLGAALIPQFKTTRAGTPFIGKKGQLFFLYTGLLVVLLFVLVYQTEKKSVINAFERHLPVGSDVSASLAQMLRYAQWAVTTCVATSATLLGLPAPAAESTKTQE